MRLWTGDRFSFIRSYVSRKIISKRFVGLADESRDSMHYSVAAFLYEKAIASGIDSWDIQLQCAHMHKECHDFRAAETRYLQALKRAPDNPEILLQLGHFYKVAGRFRDAEHFYRAATVAQPTWIDPRTELQHLLESNEYKREKERNGSLEAVEFLVAGETAHFEMIDGLIDRDLFPKTRDQLYISHQPAFVFTRNGNHQKTKWGTGQTVRGVDSLRGYIVSNVPYFYIEIFLDGKLICKQDLTVAPQRREKSNQDIKKYVYNAWIDFSEWSPGWYELLFRTVNIHGGSQQGVDWRRERIIVAEPLGADTFPACDGIVPPLDPDPTKSVVEKVNAMPSTIRPASTNSFPSKIDNVCVIRADQLGDMVVSVRALRRLRELLPHARLTALLSPANEGLGRSIGVFDEIIVIDFPDDPGQRQRIMDRQGQEKLFRKLAPYKFDLAIDLPVSGVSYKLLPLTGARVTMGYGGEGNKTLDLNLSTHDPTTNNDVMRHSARTRALVETLALWLDSGAQIVKRQDLSRKLLEPYGINQSERFIVLHSGSRIKFTQWPHYAELANKINKLLNVKIVFIAENDVLKSQLASASLESGQITYIDQSLSFDVFDAFLSFCSVFVGNDSGPKHLAGLRGAQVISLHSSRIGWSEWGQEHTGVVISRHVPCAGCSLHHDPEECGQDVACIKKITVDEVFGEVEKLLALVPVAISHDRM